MRIHRRNAYNEINVAQGQPALQKPQRLISVELIFLSWGLRVHSYMLHNMIPNVNKDITEIITARRLDTLDQARLRKSMYI